MDTYRIIEASILVIGGAWAGWYIHTLQKSVNLLHLRLVRLSEQFAWQIKTIEYQYRKGRNK